jgi:sulfonate transport system substrate-binding protein
MNTRPDSLALSRRHFLNLGIGAGALALLAACSGGSGGGSSSGSGDRRLPAKVRVGTMAPYVELAVMQQQGFLEKSLGADVGTSYHPLLSMVPMATAIAGGSLDFGHGATPTAAIAAGQKISIVATFEHNVNGSGFLVRPDGPVRTIADLRGKKIGAPTAVPSLQLKKVLDAAGLTFDDVKLVALEANVGVAGLVSGAVDVYSSFDPYFTQAIAQGKGVKLDIGAAEIQGYIPVMVNSGFLTKYPEAVRRYLVAMRDSIRWISQHGSATDELYAKNNKLDVALSRKILANRVRHLAVPSADYIDQCKQDSAFQTQQKLIRTNPDWAKVINTSIAKEVLADG